MAFSCLLVLCSVYHWTVTAGDVEAAFLNGNASERELYMAQPPRGLPGVAPGCLIRVLKGIFGLCNSPRLWWERLSKDLLALRPVIDGQEVHFEQHELDACFFLLRDADGHLRGSLITHVDDLLLAGKPAVVESMKKALSGIFPISDWEVDCFDYIGSQLKQDAQGTITLGQRSYVNSRLERVEVPKGVVPEELADHVSRKDNQSTIGALSWLAGQTRPDLQAGVSLCQRKQKHPTNADIRETNQVVKMAQAGKDFDLVYPALESSWSDLVATGLPRCGLGQRGGDGAESRGGSGRGPCWHGHLLAVGPRADPRIAAGARGGARPGRHLHVEVPCLPQSLQEHVRGRDYERLGGVGDRLGLQGDVGRRSGPSQRERGWCSRAPARWSR